jgi:hypothetical protein
LVVQLPNVLQRPQTVEVLVIFGKQPLRDSRELRVFDVDLAHGALLHEEVVEKLRDQALVVLELHQVAL